LDDREFVAPEPADEIAPANDAVEAGGDLAKDRVTRGMSVNVVDRLEAVEVDEVKGESSFLRQGAGDEGLHAGGEGTPVGQPGQRVVVGVVADEPFGAAEVADVGDAPDEELGAVG